MHANTIATISKFVQKLFNAKRKLWHFHRLQHTTNFNHFLPSKPRQKSENQQKIFNVTADVPEATGITS